MSNDNKQAQAEELTNEELLNNWKRAAADLENFKKRKETEGKEILEYAKEMVVLRLMPSLQSLEQVLSFAPKDEKYQKWLEGLRATIKQLEKTMEGLGVKKIATEGRKFDPHQHEAVQEIEGKEEDMIVDEVQPGFTLNNKVIIPAKVVVGKTRKE
ncbi:MAG: nucleotide exchange factor GrpE [Candidatus Doudnabacteria bacterium]|nr:nucleotide exchange factor GrpE [Candidatus Doudnabacteria bacterium]